MFKKIITLIAAVTMLTACGNNEVAENNSEATEKDQGSLQTEEQQLNQQENEQPTENVQAPSKENVDHSEWTSLPEYDKIVEQIGNKDYNFETVTDNEDKRVLNIIDKNGTKQYKTIFIKNTNRLKIININGGGQIFNEILS